MKSVSFQCVMSSNFNVRRIYFMSYYNYYVEYYLLHNRMTCILEQLFPRRPVTNTMIVQDTHLIQVRVMVMKSSGTMILIEIDNGLQVQLTPGISITKEIDLCLDSRCYCVDVIAHILRMSQPSNLAILNKICC